MINLGTRLFKIKHCIDKLISNNKAFKSTVKYVEITYTESIDRFHHFIY